MRLSFAASPTPWTRAGRRGSERRAPAKKPDHHLGCTSTESPRGNRLRRITATDLLCPFDLLGVRRFESGTDRLRRHIVPAD